MKLIVYYIGRPRDKHANSMSEEYLKRSSRFARCEMREIHPERFDLWAKHPTAAKTLLDPGGRAMSSAQFTALVARAEQEGRDLIFVVGGADGFSEDWKKRADLLLALSPMTLPHELARVMLAEQIYRALTTLRGHPYPR